MIIFMERSKAMFTSQPDPGMSAGPYAFNERNVRPNPAYSSVIVPIPDRFTSLGLLRRIGWGSTGDVFEIECDRKMALKVISGRNQPGRYQNALHEAEILKLLEGVPGVVHLLDMETRENHGLHTVYLLEEYACPFMDSIKASGGMTKSHAMTMILNVCSTLIACREKDVMHLDLQPRNLFISDRGEALLGDFSCALRRSEIPDHPGPRGSLAFMAPEVFRGEGVSERSEIYSLGLHLYILFHEMSLPYYDRDSELACYRRLAGMPVPPPSEHNESETPGLYVLIARACAFHPGDRFPSFEAFRDAVVGTRRELERAGHGDDWLPCDAENLFFLESTLPVSRISGFPLIPEEDPFRTIQ